MKTFLRLFVALTFSLVLGNAVGFAAGSEVLGYVAGSVTFCAGMLPMTNGVMLMASSIDISDLITEFGAYYKAGGQNMKNLIDRIYQKTETPTYAKSLIVDGTREEFSSGKISSLVQPFQKAFTSKGNLEFPPKVFDLFRMKIDWEEYPDQFVSSWLGFLTDEQKSRKDYPFVKYLIEHVLIPQGKEDMELSEYFYGEYAAPTPGTAGATGTSMNGLKYIVDAGIAADMNEVTGLSAFTAENTMDNIKEFAGTVEDALKRTPFIVLCSHGMARNYHNDRLNTHGGNPTYQKGAMDIDFVNGKLAPCASMTGSNYLIATPADNFVHLRRRKDLIPFTVEEAKRQVSVYSDWHEALGFLVDEFVYVYAPETSGSGS